MGPTLPVPAVERRPVQAPGLPARSTQPAVCSTQPRRRCSPAGRLPPPPLLLLRFLLSRLVRLQQLQRHWLVGLGTHGGVKHTCDWTLGPGPTALHHKPGDVVFLEVPLWLRPSSESVCLEGRNLRWLTSWRTLLTRRQHLHIHPTKNNYSN